MLIWQRAGGGVVAAAAAAAMAWGLTHLPPSPAPGSPAASAPAPTPTVTVTRTVTRTVHARGHHPGNGGRPPVVTVRLDKATPGTEGTGGHHTPGARAPQPSGRSPSPRPSRPSPSPTPSRKPSPAPSPSRTAKPPPCLLKVRLIVHACVPELSVALIPLTTGGP